MKHYSLTLALLLITGSAALLTAQNLLLNPGHEIYTPAPSPTNPADFCTREIVAPDSPPFPNTPSNPPHIASACASPDHLCADPRSGNAHGGFFHWASSKFENPQYELCTALTPGETYDVGAWIRLRNESGYVVDQMGFWFTDWGFHEPGAQITAQPHYRTPAGEFLFAPEYTPIGFTFSPLEAADALIVGNFLHASLPEGSQIQALPGGGGEYAYYHIDDLFVRPIPRLSGPDTLCPGGTGIYQLLNRPTCSNPPPAKWIVQTSDSTFTLEGEQLELTADQAATIIVVIGEDTLVQAVAVAPLPSAIAWESLRFRCPGDTLFLDAGFGGAASDHEWSTGQNTPGIDAADNGRYEVRFNLEGCAYTLETFIEALPEWLSPQWPDTIFWCPGEEIVLSAFPQYPYRYYSQPDGQDGDTLIYSQAGRYTIEVRPAPCLQDAFFSLDIREPEALDARQLQIPNLFSPNGDGTNDTFGVGNAADATPFSLQVFNRWGKEVFRSQDPARRWDGRFEGRDLPSDVYAYVVELTLEICGERRSFRQRGDVTLIR